MPDVRVITKFRGRVKVGRLATLAPRRFREVNEDIAQRTFRVTETLCCVAPDAP
jgi:hypothetical protein